MKGFRQEVNSVDGLSFGLSSFCLCSLVFLLLHWANVRKVFCSVSVVMLLLNEIDRNRTGVYRGERHPRNEFPRFRCYGDAITCSYAKRCL